MLYVQSDRIWNNNILAKVSLFRHLTERERNAKDHLISTLTESHNTLAEVVLFRGVVRDAGTIT